MRAWWVAGVLLAVAGLAAAAPARAIVRIVGPAGVVLPASPAGLSVETDVLNTWWKLGSCRSPAREVLRMAGRPEIRIGGNSQDRLWPKAPLPSGQRQVADQAFFHAVRCAGATGSPIIEGCIAYLDCRTVTEHHGGDHTIFIGEVVEAAELSDGEPLLFYSGQFGRWAPT